MTQNAASDVLDGFVTPCVDVQEEMTSGGFTVYRRKVNRQLARMFERREQLYPTRRPLAEVDPVSEGQPGLITRQTRVATAGSCFAWEIKKSLMARGFRYLQAEGGPATESGSARFGNIFNTACMRQIFTWAFEAPELEEPFWDLEGMLGSPYRQCVCWPDEESMRAETAAHYAAMRRLVRALDVLIVTIGQNEVWCRRDDGVTFYEMPPRWIFDSAKHACRALSIDENADNISEVVELVGRENRGAKIVLTVSPVPLLATFRATSAVQADTVSKATLRLAAEEIVRRHPGVVTYFPAYEIVTRMSGHPFVEDNRHVRPEVVERIMATFVRHFGPASGARAA